MTRKVNLFCTQGETFSYPIELTDSEGEPYNSNGIATANGAIRKSYISVNAVTINVALTTGLLTLALTANQTADMIPGRYIYDIKFTDNSGDISKPIAGIFTIAPGSTQ